MATKAELEAELAELKAQLAANAPAPGAPEEAAEADAEDTAPPPVELSDTMVRDLAAELETFAKEKPLVTLLAVFLVGYVVGRAR